MAKAQKTYTSKGLLKGWRARCHGRARRMFGITRQKHWKMLHSSGRDEEGVSVKLIEPLMPMLGPDQEKLKTPSHPTVSHNDTSYLVSQ